MLCPGPVGPVDSICVCLEQAIRFQPRPRGLGRHGQVLHLRAGQTGLDLDVGLARHREELLPASPTAACAPDEKLAPSQRACRSLHQSLALPVKGRNPRLPGIGDTIEVVGGVRQIGGIGMVCPIRDRHGYQVKPAIVETVSFPGRHEDTGVRSFGHRDVGPPVHGNCPFVRVGDAHTHQEHRGTVRQVGIDLEGNLPYPLPLVKPQDRGSVRSLDACGEERVTGKGAVADDADVPLYAATEPRIAYGEVCRLKNRIEIQELPSRGLVYQ